MQQVLYWRRKHGKWEVETEIHGLHFWAVMGHAKPTRKQMRKLTQELYGYARKHHDPERPTPHIKSRYN